MAEEKPRIMWMSSREIGMAAAFTGVTFVTVILGFIVPILPGGGSISIINLWNVGGYAGGPIVGFLIEAVGWTARPFWLSNWVTATRSAWQGILFWPARKRSLVVKILWGSVLQFISTFIYLVFIGSWFNAFVYRIIPGWEGFWAFVWLFWTTWCPPQYVVEVAWLVIAFALFPKFMTPDWLDRWRAGRAAVKAWKQRQAEKTR